MDLLTGGDELMRPGRTSTFQRLKTHWTPGRPEDVSETVSSQLLMTSPGSRRVLRGGALHGRLSSLTGVAVPPVGPHGHLRGLRGGGTQLQTLLSQMNVQLSNRNDLGSRNRVADAAVRRFVLSAQLHVDIA